MEYIHKKEIISRTKKNVCKILSIFGKTKEWGRIRAVVIFCVKQSNWLRNK